MRAIKKEPDLDDEISPPFEQAAAEILSMAVKDENRKHNNNNCNEIKKEPEFNLRGGEESPKLLECPSCRRQTAGEFFQVKNDSSDGVTLKCENCISISRTRCWTLEPELDPSIRHTEYGSNFEEPEVQLDDIDPVSANAIEVEEDPLNIAEKGAKLQHFRNPPVESQGKLDEAQIFKKPTVQASKAKEQRIVQVQGNKVANNGTSNLLKYVNKSVSNSSIQCTKCHSKFNTKTDFTKHLVCKEKNGRFANYVCKFEPKEPYITDAGTIKRMKVQLTAKLDPPVTLTKASPVSQSRPGLGLHGPPGDIIASGLPCSAAQSSFPHKTNVKLGHGPPVIASPRPKAIPALGQSPAAISILESMDQAVQNYRNQWLLLLQGSRDMDTIQIP